MEKNTITKQYQIDPMTGELMESENAHNFKERFNLAIRQISFFQWLVLAVGVGMFFLVTAVGYNLLKMELLNLHKQISVLQSTSQTTIEQVAQIKDVADDLQNQIIEVKADEDEISFENFWGDDVASLHLQSMKYLGYYLLNNQMFAHTKSTFGNRFLTTGEKINDFWRVKEINPTQMVLEGDEGKIFYIMKETQ
jgi:hypothetical protein